MNTTVAAVATTNNRAMILLLVCLSIISFDTCVSAFTSASSSRVQNVHFKTTPRQPNRNSPGRNSIVQLRDSDGPLDGVKDFVTNGVKIWSDSSQYATKQRLAMVVAGEYDVAAAQKKIDEGIASAGCVMFTWEASPSCKQAIAALDDANVNYTIVRLDDPWSEGNAMRAELGKRQDGKASVPAIYIGGTYVGGYDSGISDDAPGITAMAFRGTLRPALEKVNAISK